MLATLIADGLRIGANSYGGSDQIQADIKKAQTKGDQKEVERLRRVLKETLQIELQKKRALKLAAAKSSKKPLNESGDSGDGGNEK